MFVTEKSDTLRQGDILEKVFYTSATFHQTNAEQLSLPQGITLRQAYLVIVSQCCELQWYEDERGNLRPRRAYVLVAPLSLKIPFAQDTEEYRKLVENGENRPENDPVQYFHFEENPIIGAESVIDFSTIMPIKSSVLRDLGVQKLLELQVRHRHLFRIRLREYFSRIPDQDWEEVKELFPEESG